VPGFTLAGRIDNKRFTLIALRSARPVPVDLRELGGDRLGSGDAALLLKR
jgi:hypothetical protein